MNAKYPVMPPAAAAARPAGALRPVLDGVRLSLGVALGIGVYGAAFGLLARQAGLRPAEGLAMSGLVFAGASQFVALDFWGPHLPIASMVLAALVVNLRHVLMGAAISPWLAELSPLRRSLLLFFMIDESFAITVAAPVAPGQKASVLLGSGVFLYLCWTLSTLAGGLFLPTVADPARYGLDFVFTAAFLALLAALWRGRADLPPWLASAVAALGASWVLPGKWYIIAGALAGGLVGALRVAPAARERQP